MTSRTSSAIFQPYGCRVHDFFETPHGTAPDCVLMFTLYLDETEHSAQEKYAAVAGFRGTEDQWAAFLPAWKVALGARNSLHMSNLRWSKEERVGELLARLGPIPYQCGLVPVYGAVRVADFYDLVKDEPQFKQRTKGYFVCLAQVFCVLIQTLHGHEKVKIVCEAQTEYEINASRLFKVYKQLAGEDPRNPYLVSIEFTDKCPMLDAADFLAFAIGKNLNHPNSKKDLLCRPIHGEGYPQKCRPGMWMQRETARQTIQMVKAQVKSNR